MKTIIEQAEVAKVALDRVRELEQQMSDLESAYPVDFGTLDKVWDELVPAREQAIELSVVLAKAVLAIKGLGGIR